MNTASTSDIAAHISCWKRIRCCSTARTRGREPWHPRTGEPASFGGYSSRWASTGVDGRRTAFRLLDDAPPRDHVLKRRRQRQFHDLCAAAAEPFPDGGEILQHLSGGFRLEELRMYPRRGGVPGVHGRELRGGSGIRRRAGIVLADAGPEHGSVRDGAHQEADVIQAPGVRDHLLGAHPPVRRLEATTPFVGGGRRTHPPSAFRTPRGHMRSATAAPEPLLNRLACGRDSRGSG